jgi:CRP/FNR family transcriptional regulator, cyclic AMP receptor protein
MTAAHRLKTSEYCPVAEPVERPTSSAADRLLARAGLLHAAHSTEIAQAYERLNVVHFKRRQTIYTQGESSKHLYVIASGKVKLGRRGDDSRLHLLTILGAPEIFGALSIFDPGPRTSTATALTDMSAVVIDSNVLHGWVAHDAEVGERLLRVLARRLRRADQNAYDLVFADAAGRTASQLLRLGKQFGIQENGAIRVDHDLTQEELGQLIGSTRETVNAVLKGFSQRGWIRSRGKGFLIIDSERLARRAQLTVAPARRLS